MYIMDLLSSMDLTIFLQELSGPVMLFMQVISLLGQPEVYLLILPAIYWLYDPRLGIRLMILICSMGWSNDLLKQIFHQPRPYWLSHQVRMLDLAESATYGFPSGHSQIPLSYLGMVAYWIRKWYFWIIIPVLIFVSVFPVSVSEFIFPLMSSEAGALGFYFSSYSLFWTGSILLWYVLYPDT